VLIILEGLGLEGIKFSLFLATDEVSLIREEFKTIDCFGTLLENVFLLNPINLILEKFIF
jgi:hypothetical protein